MSCTLYSDSSRKRASDLDRANVGDEGSSADLASRPNPDLDSTADSQSRGRVSEKMRQRSVRTFAVLLAVDLDEAQRVRSQAVDTHGGAQQTRGRGRSR